MSILTCTGKSSAVTTLPEGAEHPVVLAIAGECSECVLDLIKFSERCGTLVKHSVIHLTDNPHPPEDPYAFCDCRICKFTTEMFRSLGAYETDPLIQPDLVLNYPEEENI